ncbi:MAG: UDP-3-O-acyl-N-acetylglucosamine deacetylase [Candidatus Marinimicrobia bacterium]|nr:UDP-3-O-acyl-N-acetylglucosamine deacetylase [Candidatus Neomarinimicrobiota bacterium]
MPDRYQKTICSKVSLDGIGLHTGIKSTINIKPAKENRGIVFKRIDLKENPVIKADVDYVIDTNRGTTLEQNGIRIHTVEHVLAALRGLGIDNVTIELSCAEPPIMDGSALSFVRALKKVGIVAQSVIQEVYKVTEPIQFNDPENDIEINLLPAERFKITFFMDYGLPNFGLQYVFIEDIEGEFEEEVAPARTFGLLSEVSQLKQNGLIKGGGPNNAIIIVDENVDEDEQNILSKLFGLNKETIFNNGEILNNEGLHFENEPVRHKVLDLIGDMSLFGKPIIGHIIATRSGHRTNIEFIRKLRRIVKS